MLEDISSPADLRRLDAAQLERLAAEIRTFIVESVAVTGGHLGSNLGAVELTLAVHRVFDSPRDIILWDTGHQAYVHKIVTGRREGFTSLRQAGGLSGIIEVGGNGIPRFGRGSAASARPLGGRAAGRANRRALGHTLRNSTVSVAPRRADTFERRQVACGAAFGL